MAKYKCLVCQHTFELPDDKEPICPLCGAVGTNIEEVKK